jgi:hypothetical protein
MQRLRPQRWTGPEKLVHQYLTDFPTYARGRCPEQINVGQLELAMLREAQGSLRSQLARLGIVVEANPSSNMLVGDLKLGDHPAFRLNPFPGRPVPEGSRVMVALGDDDPLTFASSLPDEFCHLYYALIRSGVAAQDAQTWLDQLRDTGLRARFTLPTSMPKKRRASDRQPVHGH